MRSGVGYVCSMDMMGFATSVRVIFCRNVVWRCAKERGENSRNGEKRETRTDIEFSGGRTLFYWKKTGTPTPFEIPYS